MGFFWENKLGLYTRGTKVCLPSQVHNLNRRQLLKYGSFLSAYGTASQLFQGQLVAQESFPVLRRLIWFDLSGGWDILEGTDPKPRSTSGIDMTYDWDLAQRLAGSTADVRIGRWLPNIAAEGRDIVVVRGISMGTTSHNAGSVYVDTGVLSNSGEVNVASIPTIIASRSDATIPLIQLQGGSDALKDRGTESVSAVRAQNLDLYRSMYPQDSDELEQKLLIMNHLRNSIGRLEADVGENDRLTAVSTAASKVETQFNENVGSRLELEDRDVRPFQSNAPTGINRGAQENFALALKLIRNNLVTSVNMGMGGFDTHANQNARLEPIMGQFDYLMSTLITELRQSGDLDTTLIVVISDFGRTPKVNQSNGRDHWPVGGALFIGGGIEGGRVVGATDNDLRALQVNADSGAPESGGVLLSPKYVCGSAISLCLGETFFDQYRSGYLNAIPALTRVRT